MILPDVNILVGAFRTDSITHKICGEWLRRTIERDTRFGVSRLSLAALVRVTSNTRTFKVASSLEEIFRFCDFLLDSPNCEVVEPGERHWTIFRDLCASTRTTGPRVTDAWYAALAIEWGCEWITFDRDFARFSGLRWRAPTVG